MWVWVVNVDQSSMIKVLVISNYRETQSVRPEAELFIGLKKAGIEVEIMTYGDAEYVARFRSAGIRVISFHPEKKWDKAAVKRIREELIAGKHDILHLFNSKAILNGIRAAQGLPVKVVLYRGYTGNVHWYDPTAWLKYLHPRTDMIWCISPAIEAHFSRQLFFDKKKAVTIPKGHSPDWYAHIDPIDLTAFGVPAGSFAVSCMANVRPFKGMAYLLEATRQLPPDAKVYWLLIGKGMDAGKNRQCIDDNPNSQKIKVLGYRQDALRIVAACNAHVLSSVRGEAMTKAVVEAMSLGVAPIITDIPGNRGLVLHGQCGLVVPPKDPAALSAAVLSLYHDRERCREYGQRAKEHIARHFHIRDTIVEMKKLYEGLVGEGKLSNYTTCN